MDKDQISALIRERAVANGVDPDVLLRIAQRESNLDPNATVGTSSAKGLFQLPKAAWQDYGQGGNPFDPVANADAGARYLKDSMSRLQGAGIETTPANLYLAHFLGQGGASKLLKADPSAPIETVVNAASIKANPTVFKPGMTVADLRAWSGGLMDDKPAAPATSVPTPQPSGLLGGGSFMGATPNAQAPAAPSAAPNVMPTAPQPAKNTGIPLPEMNSMLRQALARLASAQTTAPTT